MQALSARPSQAPQVSTIEDAQKLMALFQWAQEVWPRMEENQRRLEAHVEELIHWRQSIVDSLHHGVIAVDLEGNVNLFNRRAAELTGKNEAEVLGKPYAQAFPEHPPLLLETLRSGRPQVRELDDYPSAGLPRSMEVTTAVVRDDRPVTLGAVEVLWDLTQQREMEAQLRQARVLATLGEVAVKIAHEIRNPLGAIQLFVEMLREDDLSSEEREQALDGVFSGIKLMNNTISDLLQFTRLTVTTATFQNLAPLLDQAVTLCEHAFRMSDIRVRRDYPPVGLMCHVDESQFVKAMMNLLLNAVQAMEGRPERTLTVRARRSEPDASDPASSDLFNGAPWVRVEIEDSGCGIASDMVEKIFTPFVTTKNKGVGLGLAIVRNIVEAHGGKVTVESVVNERTCVRLLLPVYRPDVEPIS